MIRVPQPPHDDDESVLEPAKPISEPLELQSEPRALALGCHNGELPSLDRQSSSARPTRVLAASRQNTPEHLLNGSEVLLHVYDLHHLVRFVGLEIFHIGLEVYECELYFGAQGVQWCKPGSMTGHVHKQVLRLGHTEKSAWEVQAMVERMRKNWSGETYNVFNRNCQTFAIEFCQNAGLGNCIPPEFVQYSDWGFRSESSSITQSARMIFR